jgi:tetratricopeptide (TPR) repeat protein
METFSISIKELFNLKDNYTFLAGAGISSNPPSLLYPAQKICESLIKMYVPPEEIDKILEIKYLKYEVLIQLFQEAIDPELKLMNYFETVNNPNIIHFFLANAIKKGYYVATTNFDYLIEYALMDVITPKELIYPIITRRDFKTHSDPQKLFKSGKYPLYKLHGSVKNIIQNKKTRKSIITTTYALGRYRKGAESFETEEYKLPALTHLFNDRTIIIMGYSGSDEFDITPALLQSKDIKKIIWVNHNPAHLVEKSNETIEVTQYKPTKQFSGLKKSKDSADFPEKLLLDIATHWKKLKKENTDILIYKIEANTPEFVKNVLGPHFLGVTNMDLSDKQLNPIIDFPKWVEITIGEVPPQKKYEFAFCIYEACEYLDDRLRLAYTQSNTSPKTKNVKISNPKGWDYVKLGFSYSNLEKNNLAMENFQKGLEIAKKSNDLTLLVNALRGLADINRVLKKENVALMQIQESIKISEQLQSWPNIAHGYLSYAKILAQLGDFSKAFKCYEKTLQITEKTGDLKLKSWTLFYLGSTFLLMKDYENGFNSLKDALKIAQSLGENDLINEISILLKRKNLLQGYWMILIIFMIIVILLVIFG